MMKNPLWWIIASGFVIIGGIYLFNDQGLQQAVDLPQSDSVLKDQQHQQTVEVGSSAKPNTTASSGVSLPGSDSLLKELKPQKQTIAEETKPPESSPLQDQIAEETKPAQTKEPTKSSEELIAAKSASQLAAEKKYQYLTERRNRIQDEGYGRIKPIPSTENNAPLNSVRAALQDPARYPTRLSVLKTPARFDHQAYQEDKEEYLATAEPGRVNLVGKPGSGSEPIERLSHYFQTAVQGETVQLKVKAAKNCPVSFFAVNGGIFNNFLNSYSVDSGSDGIVEVDFKVTTGVIDDVNIISACPLNYSQARFIVHVSLP